MSSPDRCKSLYHLPLQTNSVPPFKWYPYESKLDVLITNPFAQSHLLSVFLILHLHFVCCKAPFRWSGHFPLVYLHHCVAFLYYTLLCQIPSHWPHIHPLLISHPNLGSLRKCLHVLQEYKNKFNRDDDHKIYLKTTGFSMDIINSAVTT